MLRAVAGPSASVASAPTFSAYMTNNVGLAGGVETKATLDVVEYNIGGYYSSANSRFTPLIQGYYQVNASGRATGTGVSSMWFNLRKNGSNLFRLIESQAGGLTICGSAMLYMNGTTDYFELWGQVSSTSGAAFDTAGNTTGQFGPRMSAFLARAV